MRKLITAGVTALAVTAGIMAGILVGTPTVASAQETTAATEAVAPGEGRESLADVLSDLVADGTLTQDQADVVEEELTARLGGHLRKHHLRLHGLDTVSDVIGIDAAELGEALRSGQTIADVAEANSVDRDDVVTALVAEANDHIDKAIENERIDDERAAELRDGARERAEAIVDGERPEGRGPFGGGFRR